MRTPAHGMPPGTRQQQEDPFEAAEAAEPGTEVTRDAGSALQPEPAAACGKEAHIVLWVLEFSQQQKTTSRQVTKFMGA
eukprot:365151-Chlamydomonas_euryale.AAC.7